MGAKIDILTFEGGLIDELVEPRATALNHGRGCRRLRNMISTAQGPAVTRPPSRYVAATKSHGQARLFKVVYSDALAFECEFGAGYVRFYTYSGQVTSGGAAYEVSSPYTLAQVQKLQVFNDAGTLYLCDGEHIPYRLVYSAATTWTLEAVPFTWGPFADANDTATTITPSATTGTGITLTASADTFLAGHEGTPILIGHRVGEAALNHTFTGNATSATIAVAKGADVHLVTHGTWNGLLILEKSFNSGASYETVGVWTPAEDGNFDEDLDELWDDAIYRFRMTSWASGVSCQATLTVDPHIAYGYATITEVTDAQTAVATVVETLAAATATEVWSLAAWNGEDGYPRCVGLVDNRLTFGATESNPTTLWLSYTNKYAQMRTGVNPADALIFTLTTRRGDPFLWIVGEGNAFYLGTPSAILEIAAADPTSSISLQNKPAITRRIDFGAGSVQPVRANGTLLFVDPSGARPMHKTYDWEQDLMLTPDLAFECPALPSPAVDQIAFQRGRVPVAWWRRTDGVLLGMTFEQRFRADVIGWHLHDTDGTIEAIDVCPSPTGDRLWWIAARTVGGATVRHVEISDPITLAPVRATGHRLDAYVSWTGTDWQDIEGLAVNGTTGRVTITVTGHGLSNGENIDFDDVEGMTWLNQQVLVVADAAANSFTLKTTAGGYVDGRLLGTYTGGGSVRQVENSFSGLGHLEGRSDVYAVADGMVLGPFTVSGGAITMRRWATQVYVGLASTWEIQPLRLVLPLGDGSSRGRQHRLAGIWASVYRSWECRAGRDLDHLELVRFGHTVDSPGEAPELFTGDKYLHVNGGYGTDPTIVLTSSEPLPFCLRAMMLDVEIAGTRAT